MTETEILLGTSLPAAEVCPSVKTRASDYGQKGVVISFPVRNSNDNDDDPPPAPGSFAVPFHPVLVAARAA